MDKMKELVVSGRKFLFFSHIFVSKIEKIVYTVFRTNLSYTFGGDNYEEGRR